MLTPRTFPACRCGGRFEPARTAANHDRPALVFLRCPSCRRERDHQVETPPPGGLADLRARKRAQMDARLARARGERPAAPVPHLVRRTSPAAAVVQRDNLRRALAARPSLYLAEEPTC